jgi:inner membrane protein
MEPLISGRTARRPILKLLALGGLVLLLLIPVAQLLGLVRERASRREEVRAELSSLWGGEQILGALVLAIPYRPRLREPAIAAEPVPPAGFAKAAGTAATEVEPGGWLCFLPKEVQWKGTLRPETRRRGIFEVTLYDAAVTAIGAFDRPDPVPLGIAGDRVDWDSARVVLLLGDVRGLQRNVTLGWRDASLPFQPGGGPLDNWGSAIHARLGKGAFAAGPARFRVDLALRGSEALRIVPLGASTQVELAAGWADPGFVGAPLPTAREVGDQGFTATWDVPLFSRSFSQQWRLDQMNLDSLRGELHTSAFGVQLVRPADPYQQTERAVKYAVLFILLTFTTVFLLELMSPVRLHAVHYLLVGVALCLFYLLLLALAEHLGMAAAYGLATFATVATVGLYARSVLASGWRAAVVSAALVALYGWLFTVLRAEDYALLLGALGLFATLAGVMYLTRKLDWSTLRFREPAAATPPAG